METTTQELPEMDTPPQGEGPVFSARDAKFSEARIAEDLIENPPKEEKVYLKRGTAGHIPTEGTRGAVTMLAAFRIPHTRIAAALKISKMTLYKYYTSEIENAETIVDAEVLKAWMKLVKAGDSLTINRYMERKFRFSDETGGVASAMPSVMVIDNIPAQAPPEIAAPISPPVIDVTDE